MPDQRPRHLQIAADLRAQIMAGAFPAGAKLPSVRQLGERYEAPSATVQRALRVLKDEGFAAARAGKDTYVRDRRTFVVEEAAYFEPSPGGYSYRVLNVAEVTPPGDVAEALGEDHAVLRYRLTLHAGDPIELVWSYYPASIAAGTELTQRGRIRGGAPRVLSDLGYAQQDYVERVSARQPTTEEVEGLDLPTGVPVLRQFRVIHAEGGRPIEVQVMIKGAHENELQNRQVVAER